MGLRLISLTTAAAGSAGFLMRAAAARATAAADVTDFELALPMLWRPWGQNDMSINMEIETSGDLGGPRQPS